MNAFLGNLIFFCYLHFDFFFSFFFNETVHIIKKKRAFLRLSVAHWLLQEFFEQVSQPQHMKKATVCEKHAFSSLQVIWARFLVI